MHGLLCYNRLLNNLQQTEHFQDKVWPALIEAGWRLERGSRKNDRAYFPPGVTRGPGIKNRVHYFDSVRQVLGTVGAQAVLAGLKPGKGGAQNGARDEARNGAERGAEAGKETSKETGREAGAENGAETGAPPPAALAPLAPPAPVPAPAPPAPAPAPLVVRPPLADGERPPSAFTSPPSAAAAVLLAASAPASVIAVPDAPHLEDSFAYKSREDAPIDPTVTAVNLVSEGGSP